MCMLNVRDADLCKEIPNRRMSYYFTSFLFLKLMDAEKGGKKIGYCYENVQRWCKKCMPNVDVFELARLYCPINVDNFHWTLLVIFFQRKIIYYFDSMGNTSAERYLRGALRFLGDISKGAGKAFDVDEWTLVKSSTNYPQQGNGYDCGVFVIMYADYLSDNLPFNFSQDDIALFRKRIILNIMKKSWDYKTVTKIADATATPLAKLNPDDFDTTNAQTQRVTEPKKWSIFDIFTPKQKKPTPSSSSCKQDDISRSCMYYISLFHFILAPSTPSFVTRVALSDAEISVLALPQETLERLWKQKTTCMLDNPNVKEIYNSKLPATVQGTLAQVQARILAEFGFVCSIFSAIVGVDTVKFYKTTSKKHFDAPADGDEETKCFCLINPENANCITYKLLVYSADVESKILYEMPVHEEMVFVPNIYHTAQSRRYRPQIDRRSIYFIRYHAFLNKYAHLKQTNKTNILVASSKR